MQRGHRRNDCTTIHSQLTQIGVRYDSTRLGRRVLAARRRLVVDHVVVVDDRRHHDRGPTLGVASIGCSRGKQDLRTQSDQVCGDKVDHA